MEIETLSKTQIENLLSALNLPPRLDHDYIYDVYEAAINGLNHIDNKDITSRIYGINHMDIIQYIVGEYFYSTVFMNNEDYEKFNQDEERATKLASLVLDKYLSLSFFNLKERKLTNRYLPPISSLQLYINFMLNIVNEYKTGDPKTSLIADLLNKSLTISNCILDELTNGYETEAFGLWRTLHESECILILLDQYKEVAINAYLKHMQYGLAYKKFIDDKELLDKIFETIKSEMKALDLKSKDMKKYIEYGWLTSFADFKNSNLKLNFRDGLEVLANLNQYSERYMESSEILHSTPLLIYSSKEYFYYATLLSVYESFFRLEKVFVTLFASKVSKDRFEQYVQMRNVYYPNLISIHKAESNNFIIYQTKRK